jgi:N-methylhydantoinase B/oxoprolinase/acetone carboxylase alpha subunit
MSPILHFGAGSISIIDTVEIIWSSSIKQTFTNIAVNAHYRLTQGNSLITDIRKHESNTVPAEIDLLQNYPNPFNPTTVISYQIPTSSQTTLVIYDALGRIAATLVNEKKEAGSYTVSFDGGSLAGQEKWFC